MLDTDDLQRRMDGAIASLRTEFASLRTGRASSSMLDPVMVDAYGQKTPINQVGTVNVSEPRMVTINVWDKAMVGKVEKAIRESGLGINPQLGRQFTVDEAELSAPPVAIISHGYWQRNFGGSPDVVDRTLVVNGQVTLDDAALDASLRVGAGVALDHVHTLNHHATTIAVDAQHATPLAGVLAGHHLDVVALLDLHHRLLQHLGRERHDLHEAFASKFARHRAEDTGSDRLQLVVQQHCGVAVETDY